MEFFMFIYGFVLECNISFEKFYRYDCDCIMCLVRRFLDLVN